jgi:diguanylate cyclase (GGDEF)-like protein
VDARGKGHVLLNKGRPVLGPGGEFLGYRGVVHDITDRERLGRQLKQMAERDSLTGLLNRRAMHEALRVAMQGLEPEQRGHWLCYIDLDHFKQVNDCAGHAAGDGVLRRFAQLMRESTRAGEKLARMGGDEFCLLLSDSSRAGAEAVAGRILVRIDELAIEWEGLRLAPGASLGLAELRRDESVEALFARVDAACYQSKREGRNRVTVATT